MPAKLSTYAADLVLGILRGGTLSYDTSGNVLCLTSDQPDDGAYTKITGTDYADLDLLTSDWSAPSSRITNFASTKDFPTVGVGGWGTVAGYAIEDSAGNTLFSASLVSGFTVVENDIVGTNSLSLKISFVTDHIGDWFADAIPNALLRGESLGAIPYSQLKFTSSTGSVLALEPIQIPASTGSWSAPAGRSISNAIVLESEIATQNYEIAGWQITNDEDNILWVGTFPAIKSLRQGRKLVLAADSITLSA